MGGIVAVFGAAFGAIGAGLRDVLSPRLLALTLACVVLAFGATSAAAWAAFTYALPLIPEGEGWMGRVWDAAQFLGGALIVVLAIVLAPGVSMLIGGALFDVAAARIEKDAGLPTGRMVPIGEGMANGFRIALPALALNILALPLLFVPIANIVVFIGLNAGLMGREYFSLAAVRRMSWQEARALRRRHGGAIFIVGIVAALLPFIAPLFGAAAMTRLMKALSARSDTR